MYQELKNATDQFPHSTILCIGDIMLDRFRYGEVTRLSPEAPVPVLKITHERTMLGGVGNVAANAKDLGCNTLLLSIIGNDKEGETIQALLQQKGIQAICHHTDIHTTTKTRHLTGNTHLLREDQEDKANLSPEEKNKLKHLLKTQLIPNADIVLLSDYNKGFLDTDFIQYIIQVANDAHKSVLVDPKGTDYSKYTGATLIKPNLKELAEASHQELSADTQDGLRQIENAANDLRKRYSIQNIVVTLGAHGMLAVTDSGNSHIPTMAREVYDVSGAGDTSLATLGAALTTPGLSIQKAMHLANVAAGLVVAKSGTATVSLNELQQELQNKQFVEQQVVAKKQISHE